ncbi:MAG: hypothetical protein DYG94_15055, partial [Leptolyngbya sp. PLA3]|nr:hypothetical protein [Leptolyngbya sp. PL-A3]
SDHLGSPRALVDVVTGAVAWRADFDAWGNRTLTAGTADFLPFGFAGGMFDPETGLTRFGARDYDPVVGRWTAKDPAGFRNTEINFYLYAAADPVNRRDPKGRNLVCDIVWEIVCEYGCKAGHHVCLPICILMGLTVCSEPKVGEPGKWPCGGWLQPPCDEEGFAPGEKCFKYPETCTCGPEGDPKG